MYSGKRVTVGMIVEALAAGQAIEQLLFDFPYLEEENSLVNVVNRTRPVSP